MAKRKNAIWAVALALTGSCALAGPKSVENSYRPDVEVTDDQTQEAVLLSWVNRTGERACFDAFGWPSKGGIIDNDGQNIWLTVGGERHYLRPENDYCPSCETVVEKNAMITGQLRYASFGLPRQLFSEPKTLNFHPNAYSCPQKGRAESRKHHG